MAKHALGVGEEVARDAEVLGVLVGNSFDPTGRKGVNMGIGIGHDDGGVRGNDELGSLLDEIVNAGDDGELAAWR